MQIVVDTGAIIGALNTRDQHFLKAGPIFRELPKPLLTCEAVITEVLFVLRHMPRHSTTALDLISSGILKLDYSLQDDVESVQALLKKYRSVPMSLADACLVRMSELFDAPVFTFDSDFRIYRRRGRQPIRFLGLDEN